MTGEIVKRRFNYPDTIMQRFCCHLYLSIVQESNTVKCSTKKVNKQVDEWRSKKDAIEPIQHSTVPGKKFA